VVCLIGVEYVVLYFSDEYCVVLCVCVGEPVSSIVISFSLLKILFSLLVLKIFSAQLQHLSRAQC